METNVTINSYLTFVVNEETFAISVKYVKNILEVPVFTALPNTPDYVRGVMNFRGDAIAVVDTSLKLSLPEIVCDTLTSVLVLEIENEVNVLRLGALVNRVQEVIEVADNQIKPIPANGQNVHMQKYVLGLISNEDSFIMILDVEKIFDINVFLNSNKVA